MPEAPRLEIKVGVDLAEARRTVEAFRAEQSKGITMGGTASAVGPYPAHSATSAAIQEQLPTLRSTNDKAYVTRTSYNLAGDDEMISANRELARAKKEQARAILDTIRASRFDRYAPDNDSMVDGESRAVVDEAQAAQGVGMLGRRSRLMRYVAARMLIPGRAGMVAGLGFSAMPDTAMGVSTLAAGGAMALAAAPFLYAGASGDSDVVRSVMNGGSPADVVSAKANSLIGRGVNFAQQLGVDMQATFGSNNFARIDYKNSVQGIDEKTRGIQGTLGVAMDATIQHWDKMNEIQAARLRIDRIGNHDRFDQQRQASRDEMNTTITALNTERDVQRLNFFKAVNNNEDVMQLDARDKVDRNGYGQIISIGGATPGTADYNKNLASWRSDFMKIAIQNPDLYAAMTKQDNFEREYPMQMRTAKMNNAANQEDINFQVDSAIRQNKYESISSSASREGDKLAASLARINKEMDVQQDKYGHIIAFGDVTAKKDPALFASRKSDWDEARTQAGVDEQNRITRRQGSIASGGFAMNDDPLDAHLAELQSQRKAELNGVTKPAEISSINSLYDVQESVAKRSFAYGTVGIKQDLQWQRQGLQRGLARDPEGEKIAGIMGGASQYILGLQQSGHGDQAQYAADNTKMELQLSKQDYLNAFRGEQYDFRLMRPNKLRDTEDPATVVAEFDKATKQATNMPRDLKSQVNKTQQGEGDLSSAIAAIQNLPQAIKEAILAIASN